MKKFISLLLVTVMSIMCFSAVTVSAEDTSSTITLPFTDDFSGARTDGMTNYWLRGATSNPFIDKNNATLSPGETTTNTLWAWGNATFGLNLPSITSGTVLFSFDIDPQTIATNATPESLDRTLRMYVGGGTLTSDNLSKAETDANFSKAAGFEIKKDKDATKKYFHGGWGTGFRGDTENECTGKGWRHIDVVVDMDNKTLAAYLDNKILNSGNKLPDTFTGVNSLLFVCALGNSTAFIDNVNIVKNPVMSVTNVEANEAAKYVDVAFNYDVTNEISVSDITINNANNNERAAVTRVEKPSAKVIRAYYDNLNGGNYTININNVSSLIGNISVSKSFRTALAYLSEDFEKAEINTTDKTVNKWMKIENNSADVSITDGKLVVKGGSGSGWEQVILMNLLGNTYTENQAFMNIYKAIREGGVNGGTFKAGTTYTGKLSYEFDMKMDQGTVVMYTYTAAGGRRIFRTNVDPGSANGFYAGTSEKIDSVSANTTYKIKVVFDFEKREVEYYINGKHMSKKITDTIYNGGNLSDVDVFTRLYFGVYNGVTATFDNFMIKYYADNCNVQNLKVSSEGTTYTVTGEIINLSADEIGSAVIFALYDKDNGLVDAKLIEKPTLGFGQTVLNETYTLAEGTSFTRGKAFIWDMNNSIRPLCNAKDLNN